jgi:tetratricopeptide (TPR) repeat protein
VKSWATLPDGTQRVLLRIEDWDFNWQDQYTFAVPVLLPHGSTIAMEITYDNSDGNIHNRSHPPVRVRTGERSVDEMGNITFQVVPRDAAGMNHLREARYRDLLAQADIPRNHYNLANALADEGRVDEAIAHYRRATEEDPGLSPAYFNLGNLLFRGGDRAGAIAAFHGALAAKPDSVDALVNLGHAVEADRPAEALAHYRRALAIDPKSGVAHESLAAALAARGERAAAIEEFQAGLEVDPDNAHAHLALGRLFDEGGRRDAAIDELARALRLDPTLAEAHARLRALGADADTTRDAAGAESLKDD